MGSSFWLRHAHSLVNVEQGIRRFFHRRVQDRGRVLWCWEHLRTQLRTCTDPEEGKSGSAVVVSLHVPLYILNDVGTPQAHRYPLFRPADKALRLPVVVIGTAGKECLHQGVLLWRVRQTSVKCERCLVTGLRILRVNIFPRA